MAVAFAYLAESEIVRDAEETATEFLNTAVDAAASVPERSFAVRWVHGNSVGDGALGEPALRHR